MTRFKSFVCVVHLGVFLPAEFPACVNDQNRSIRKANERHRVLRMNSCNKGGLHDRIQLCLFPLFVTCAEAALHNYRQHFSLFSYSTIESPI